MTTNYRNDIKLSALKTIKIFTIILLKKKSTKKILSRSITLKKHLTQRLFTLFSRRFERPTPALFKNHGCLSYGIGLAHVYQMVTRMVVPL